MTEAIIHERNGHVAILTINRPEARNAVNAEVAQGLERAIDRIEADGEIRVAVLTGAPPTFCAGADLKEIEAGRRDQLRTARGGFAGVVARARHKPLVAAVEGAALGGGAEICLACDLVVASRAASFAFPETKRGLVAAAGGLFRLPQKIPLNVAVELALTGESLPAEDAHRLGLVSRLAEPGAALDEAMVLARQIAANAPAAVQATRRVMLAAPAEGDGNGWELSEAAMAEVMATDDMKEGVAAFLEKRAPRWSGR
jgi:enoyl-CoA hydratase